MQPLEKSLRNTLEKTVKEARDIAEEAARSALGQLGVADASAPGHLTDEERQLRRKLRIHGRQLGDALGSEKVQSMDRLLEEVAYEHWHRMLFARFLAENNLLMYPDPDDPVAISLEECEDLAADEGAANGWELAARFAARMLPQIFRPDFPVFQLVLPPEHQQQLERLVAGLPGPVFSASDSLGWVYQFWQAKRKDEVNASEVKIGARELPAVTQLFTEPYMVAFLLDNALGAWWAARRLSEADLKNAKSEEELREKASIPGVPLEYLRFVQEEDGSWTPAAGTFDAWPENLSELKTLDPCCGSGHFLVAAFLMLVSMRMELEGLSAQESVDAVLRENIHGLELDQRCVELAAFALALTAWNYPEAGGYRLLPGLDLACCGSAIGVEKTEWLELAGDDANLRLALEDLFKQFKDAPILGSLIDPSTSIAQGSLFEVKLQDLVSAISSLLVRNSSFEQHELAIVAKGLAKAAALLSDRYDLVMTNVPFLATRKQNHVLLQYLETNFFEERFDLAVAMISRSLEFLTHGGTIVFVSPQTWQYLGSYKGFRNRVIQKLSLSTVTRLGSNAFDTISGQVVNASLSILSNRTPTPHEQYVAIDASGGNDWVAKRVLLQEACLERVSQSLQLCNPDSTVMVSSKEALSFLDEECSALAGIATGDSPRFYRNTWEIQDLRPDWKMLQASLEDTSHHEGRTLCVLWENEKGSLFEFVQSMKHLNSAAQRWKTGQEAWGKNGVVATRMGNIRRSLYTGSMFDQNVAVIVPIRQEDLPAIWAFCESEEYVSELRMTNPNLAISSSTVAKVPFDLDHWTKIAEAKYPKGLPQPYTDDLTQWIFHGHPCGSVIWDENAKWTTHGPLRTDDTVLQVAVARLLGYRWPAELDPDMNLAEEQREWVCRCEALLPYSDEDGIVCITPVRGEDSAADRLLNLLVDAYGSAWSSDIQNQLLKSASHAGKSLESWLRDKFFSQHCKTFQHRPFIWHIWDGLRDGFAALVNYHKLDRKNLETLTYTYLGDWISRQKQDLASGIDGAQEKLDRAETLKKSLELILEGEAPYDIFVRWKPLHEQPIGWDPDLNDGVRMNIRPFLTVPDVGKKGAGILRDKPNIKWTKDRGKDVESAPWYPVFKGDRINDHHLTLEEKKAARGSKP